MASKFKMTVLVLSVSLAISGCTTTGMDGKASVNKGTTAMAGAGIGALLGAAIGGKKGALIGAALGGGLGFVVGLEAQKKELETARLAAVELSSVSPTELKLSPTVYTQNYQDTKTGENVEGLKYVDVPLPLHQMLQKNGSLTEKGAATIAKLQAVSEKTGGQLEIAIPSNSKTTTLAAFSKAAPGAKIVLADIKSGMARIGAKPIGDNGSVKIVA